MCPFNWFAVPHSTEEFFPSEGFLSLDVEKLREMSEGGFREVFGKSVVRRVGVERLRRNLQKLGNADDADNADLRRFFICKTSAL